MTYLKYPTECPACGWAPGGELTASDSDDNWAMFVCENDACGHDWEVGESSWGDLPEMPSGPYSLTDDELREELCKVTHWLPDSVGTNGLVALFKRLLGPPPNESANLGQVPECVSCGAPPTQAHDPLCKLIG